MKVWKTEVLNETSDKEPGTILKVDKDGIRVATKDKILLIEEIQMPNKKRVAVCEYIKGNIRLGMNMIDIKKYLTTIGILIAILILGTAIINIFISSLVNIFGLLINILVLSIIIIIIFSTIVTYNIIKDKKVNSSLMKINLKIANLLFNPVIFIASSIGIPKNEMRKIYVKLNNSYIYSNKYNFNSKDIMILIPHCVQKNSCKLKVTNKIENCAKCGLCNVSDLVKLKEKTGINIFIATGGTLARKVIIENKPKAVIAVACERDLTSGIQDMKHIPVLGIFNKRPNGPCVDTFIDIHEVEDAINFLTNKK